MFDLSAEIGQALTTEEAEYLLCSPIEDKTILRACLNVARYRTLYLLAKQHMFSIDLSFHQDDGVRYVVAENALDHDVLNRLNKDRTENVRWAVVHNEFCPLEILLKIKKGDSRYKYAQKRIKGMPQYVNSLDWGDNNA
jgi:hypothetical protein